MLRDGLENVARREHIDQMMTQIKHNADSLTSLERKVETTNEANDRRFRSIEERLDATPVSRSTSPEDRDRSRKAAFDKSRRSFRAWPIDGSDQAELRSSFKDFAVDALQVPEDAFEATAIQEIIRVRTSPHNAIYKEALITFGEIYDRDFFYGKARNLSEYRDSDGRPTAGLRLDVPPFLLPTFKILNEHGYEIRSVHGQGTKRYIKFDEINLSLLLEVRLPGQVKWLKIRPEQARTYGEEKDQIQYQTIRKDLLSGRGPLVNNNPNLMPLGSKKTSGEPQAIAGSLSTFDPLPRRPPVEPALQGQHVRISIGQSLQFSSRHNIIK